MTILPSCKAAPADGHHQFANQDTIEWRFIDAIGPFFRGIDRGRINWSKILLCGSLTRILV